MRLFSALSETVCTFYLCVYESLGEHGVLSSRPVAAGELIAFSLSVCAGFWRLLSLQASCRGEEGFVWPQGDAHPTAKRTSGKTVVSSHTAHCWQQKAKRQIGLHAECVYITREKDASVNDSLSNCILFSPRRSFHLSP